VSEHARWYYGTQAVRQLVCGQFWSVCGQSCVSQYAGWYEHSGRTTLVVSLCLSTPGGITALGPYDSWSVVSLWSACGQSCVSQHAGWYEHSGRTALVVSLWSACGQSVSQHARWYTSTRAVRHWWSVCGQPVVSLVSLSTPGGTSTRAVRLWWSAEAAAVARTTIVDDSPVTVTDVDAQSDTSNLTW